jgi:formate dehydrogenase major subunit
MANTISIKINGKDIQTESGKTILQAARDNGIDIPAMCYEPRLEPHRGCLVCSVEDMKTNKLVISCAVPAADGMVIETHSPTALAARKSALELVLSLHYADCKGPCLTRCPANVDIQGYLALAAVGKYKEALELIRETNPMPLMCGRVCVRYCEANCRRNYADTPAALNFVKRYVADLEYDRLEKPVPVPKNGKKVAVIGGGPSGLSCAYFIAKKGYEATIFEAQPKLGGMVRYGIPDYRLPPHVLDKEINYIIGHGINVETNTKLGKDITLDDLKAKGFDAIYISIGSWVGKPMGVEGEKYPFVQTGIKFLEDVKKAAVVPKLKGTVAVVGGGNTAVDVARTAIRCGADKVALLYRRTLDEMPADKEEIHDAAEEGIELKLLTAPKRVVSDNGNLIGLECFEMYLGEPDASGRRKPLVKENSEFLFKCDMIVSAIGQESDLSSLANKSLGDIKTTKWKTIEIDEKSLATSVPGVFSGGDVALGPMAAIDAIGTGRKAAIVIDQYLKTGKIVQIPDEFLSSKESLEKLDKSLYEHVEKTERSHSRKLDPKERIKTFDEVDLGVTPEIVAHEASRCLTCGCVTIYDCDLKTYSTEVGAQQKAFAGKFKKYKVDAEHPYITLDPNKCVLCGRCVRYCGDLIGINALGFINRGNSTVVKPALDKPLAETTCIGCGNCIEVCPTGAIEFNYPYKRQAPFKTVEKRTICSECGVGCEIDLNAYDRDIFYITAKPYDKYIEGELCKKGRFESSYYVKGDRIIESYGTGRETLSIEAATRKIVEELETVKKKHGGDSILFLASPKATTEEIFLLSSMAGSFGSSMIASADDLERGQIPDISPLIGLNLSTATREDVAKADVILNIGSGLTENSAVFGFAVKRAVGKGAQFIQIGPLDSELERYASLHVDCKTGKEGQIINALGKSIVKSRKFDAKSAKMIDGFAKFKANSLKAANSKNKKVLDGIAAILLDNAKNVVIIYNDTVAGMAAKDAKAAVNLLLCTGRVNKPGNGVMIIHKNSDCQGYRDIVFSNATGFSSPDKLKKIKEALLKGKIRAIFSLNENLKISAAASKKINFIAALATEENDMTDKASVVVPYSPATESDGSVVSFDGKVVKFKKAFDPLPGFTNFGVLNMLIRQATGASYDINRVRGQIAEKLPQYAALANSAVDSFSVVEEAKKNGHIGKQLKYGF